MEEFLLKRCQNGATDGVEEARRELGLTWPQVYASADTIAQLARRIQANKGRSFAQLPFCHTLEAECLGAHVNIGDEVGLARAGKPCVEHLKDVLALELKAENSARLRPILDAVAQLESTGTPVMFCLSGPLATLSCLCDLRSVFTEARKDPDLFRSVMGHLIEQECALVDLVLPTRPTRFELADPASAVSIVGPRFASRIAEDFTEPFLQRLTSMIGPQTQVAVCPLAATQKMKKSDLASNIRIGCPKA